MKNPTNYDLDQHAWRATVQTALNKTDRIILQATSEATNQEIDLEMHQETNRAVACVITDTTDQAIHLITAEATRRASDDAIHVATAESAQP